MNLENQKEEECYMEKTETHFVRKVTWIEDDSIRGA